MIGIRAGSRMKARSSERIALLSDGTCDTAETYVRAILAQFNRTESELTRFPKIRTDDQLVRALEKLEPPFLVAYTFAEEKLRKIVWTEIRKRNLTGVDILYPAIDIFSTFFKDDPTENVGALHNTRAVNYFDRIEAVEFTVKHDDGLRLNDLHEADIILTGCSRTSKTPTCMYLANKGYRVANVPLIYGIDPSKELIAAHEKGIPVILLTLAADQLARIRRSRFERLGTAPNQSDTYVDLKLITDELEAARRLAMRYRWSVIDVTNKAIEESASEILLLVSSKQR